MASPDKSIAFIGLGVMGYGMAVNLRQKIGLDTTIYVCDVNSQALGRYKEETGAHGPIEVVQTGFEAAIKADVVFTMLPNGPVVEKVYLDDSTGILAGIKAAAAEHKADRLIVECGTIESASISTVAKEAATLNSTLSRQYGTHVDFVDAPVSGGPMGAHAGTLAFMVGSDNQAVFENVKKDLLHMGAPQSIFHCGPIGAGTAFKLINNYISAITSLGSSEALNIGVKLGYDPKRLTEVINASGGQNWIISKSNPVPGVQENVPSSRNYEGGFRIELCKHVLEMGIDLARLAGARTILDKPTLRAFEEAAADERYKGKDARVVYKWLSEST